MSHMECLIVGELARVGDVEPGDEVRLRWGVAGDEQAEPEPWWPWGADGGTVQR